MLSFAPRTVLLGVLCLAPLPALADPALLTVTGQGSASVISNEARITASIDGQAATPDAAIVAGRQALDRVTAALRQLGVADKDIVTSNRSLQPQYAGSTVGALLPGQSRPITGYTVTDQLIVIVENPARTDAVLGALVAAGARQASDRSTYTRADMGAAAVQARAAAVKDAMARAQILAQQTGVTLGALQAVSDGTAQTTATQNILEQTLATLGQLNGTQQTVTANVTLSWAIKGN